MATCRFLRLGLFLLAVSLASQADGHGLKNNGEDLAFDVVDISASSVSGDMLLAVRAAQGLWNRNNATLVYGVQSDDDRFWLSELVPRATQRPVSVKAFLAKSLAQFGAVLYDVSKVDLVPSVVTLAGLVDGVPITVALYDQFQTTTVKYDATVSWPDAASAVQFVAAWGLNQTSSLAFQAGHRFLDKGYLADWLVQQRVFSQYLNDSCLPLTKNNEILKRIVAQAAAAGAWSKPVRVYGYNSADVIFGGDLFEAETDCINVLGQVASAHSNNFAFWSQVYPFDASLPRGSASGPMQQPEPPKIVYDPSKIYVALVYGDMDNLDFVETFGRKHMQVRSQRCRAQGDACFPLSWTLSPNLVRMAPQMLRWYYSQAAATNQNKDWFIMPPSGTLYSYPGEMPEDTQQQYVAQQNEQANIMDTEGSVHWEWEGTWSGAWNRYFPRYLPNHAHSSCSSSGSDSGNAARASSDTGSDARLKNAASSSSSPAPAASPSSASSSSASASASFASASASAAGPRRGSTRFFFLNNVPWVIPILDMWFKGETYRIVGDPALGPEQGVVAFRPAFNWQKDQPSGGLPYNASVIADLVIDTFAAGSVQYVYVIQNTDVDALFDMVQFVAQRAGPRANKQIEFVGYQQLADLAFQRSKHLRELKQRPQQPQSQHPQQQQPQQQQ